jgi:hypothetical protein
MYNKYIIICSKLKSNQIYSSSINLVFRHIKFSVLASFMICITYPTL